MPEWEAQALLLAVSAEMLRGAAALPLVALPAQAMLLWWLEVLPLPADALMAVQQSRLAAQPLQQGPQLVPAQQGVAA